MPFDDAWLAQQLQKPGYRLVGETARHAPESPQDGAQATNAMRHGERDVVPEGAFMERLRRLCVDDLHLLWYHTYCAKKSTPGWPDMACVLPVELAPTTGSTLYLWELKATDGHPSPAQRRWLDALRRVTRVDARCVWPEEWTQLVDLLTQRIP